MLQEMTLEKGRKYRGTAWVNDYGELHFRPEQKGTKPGNFKQVLENDVFSLCESKNLWRVTIKIAKKDFHLQSVTNIVLLIVQQIKAYMM